MRNMILAGMVALGAAGCASNAEPESVADSPPAPSEATAEIRDSAGMVKARANIVQVGTDLRVRIEASGMSRGAYGAHVHEAGRCDPPGFTTAGAHWNPSGRKHGKDNPAGMHKGDLPNLLVGADGSGIFEITIHDSVLSGRGGSILLDGDGAAIVIHAAPDDFRTDPSGNSGARIACGVLG
ncbi:MAG TPA: superoxide dismutase family protein [Allosphingosinicella sp.]